MILKHKMESEILKQTYKNRIFQLGSSDQYCPKPSKVSNFFY